MTGVFFRYWPGARLHATTWPRSFVVVHEARKIRDFYHKIPQPSEEHLELLDPTVALSITHDQFKVQYRDFPEFNYIVRLQIEKYYVLSGPRT